MPPRTSLVYLSLPHGFLFHGFWSVLLTSEAVPRVANLRLLAVMMCTFCVLWTQNFAGWGSACSGLLAHMSPVPENYIVFIKPKHTSTHKVLFGLNATCWRSVVQNLACHFWPEIARPRPYVHWVGTLITYSSSVTCKGYTHNPDPYSPNQPSF